MVVHQFVAATTTSGANYNSLNDAWCKESKYPRQLVRIGFAGSAAPNDIYFDVYFQDRLIASHLIPTTVGANMPDDDDMMALSGGEICPAGTEVRLLASGDATTNNVYCCLEFKERPDLMRRIPYKGRRY